MYGNKEDIKALFEKLDRKEYGETVSVQRLLFLITGNLVSAIYMERLLRYAFSPNSDTVFNYTLQKEAIPLASHLWLYLFDENQFSQKNRRVLKSLEEQGFIQLHVASFQRVKTTYAAPSWDVLDKRTKTALAQLLRVRVKLESAFLPSLQKTWDPAPCKLIPFEFIFSSALDHLWEHDSDLLHKAVTHYTTCTDNVCFKVDGWRALLEEPMWLNLDSRRWDFRRRLEETMRTFSSVFPGTFLNIKQGLPDYEKQFNVGVLDLVVLQCNGVLFSGYTNVSLGEIPRPKKPHNAIHWAYDQHIGLLGACFSNLRNTPISDFFLQHNLRLGWLESRLIGKKRAAISLLRDLLQSPRYADLDHVQTIGLFHRLFPNALNQLDTIVKNSSKTLTIKEERKRWYDALYPGTVSRLEYLCSQKTT